MITDEMRERLRIGGSKGGKAKVPKGTAINGRAKEIGRLGGIAKRENAKRLEGRI